MIIINYLELKETDKDYLRLKNLHEACFKDLTGKKFGKLTVLNIDHIEGKKYFWKCKCDCGNYCVAMTYVLTTGHTKSCGCLHKLAGMKDLTGKKFGNLLVIEYSHKEGRNHFWKCKCDCGNLITVTKNYLTNGKFPSCGCISTRNKNKINNHMRKYNLTGNRYGKLLVLYPIVGSKWHCKCDCGNYKDINTSDLIRGYTKSCGCSTVNLDGSAPELEIKEFISAMLPNSPILKERILNFKGRKKEIDIYIPDYKLGIEFNGSAFHASKNVKLGKCKPKYYHRDKFLQAKKQGIRLISIFDKDFNENKNGIFTLLSNIIMNNETHNIPTESVVYTNNDFDDGNWLKSYGYIEDCQIEPDYFIYGHEGYVVYRCGTTKWIKVNTEVTN